MTKLLPRHLIHRSAAAADGGADEGALLAADERADAGARAARSADHERALLPRAGWTLRDHLVIAHIDRRRHPAHDRAGRGLGGEVRAGLIARRRREVGHTIDGG